MAKTLKIAILRGRNDTSGLMLTAALDQACQEMLVTHPLRYAVLEYWTDVTDGYFQFNVTVMPWVDVAFSSADANPAGMITRQTQFNKISTATKALPGRSDLSMYDGFIVLTGPGAVFANPLAGQPGQPATLRFDGGASGRGRHGAVGVYPIATSDHSFMCHEFGHVLGLLDAEGITVTKAGGVTDTAYGDPLEIMSDAVFGGASPTFNRPAIPGWPNANAMQSMGPAPSRAEIHYFFPEATPSQSVKSIVVLDDNAPTIRLHAAYGTTNSPRLVVINTLPEVPYSLGRCYIEYRDGRWWDEGLKTASAALDRQSVVFHVVDTRPPDLGAGDTTGVRTFYRGQIVVPVEIDSDIKVRGTPYTVRVVHADAEQRYVDLKITRSSPRGFEIGKTGEDVTMPSQRKDIYEIRHSPCGDELRWGRWRTIATYAFRPITWGLGGEGSSTATPSTPPTISWTVGGVSVPAGAPSGTLPNCSAPEGVFDVKFTLDAASGTLTLTSAKEGQTYHMPIRATATHTGDFGEIVQTPTFDSLGSYIGYPPSDVIKLARCLVNVLAKLHVNPADFVLPDGRGPRPNWHERTQIVIQGVRSIVDRYSTDLRSLERIAELGMDLRLPPGSTG